MRTWLLQFDLVVQLAPIGSIAASDAFPGLGAEALCVNEGEGETFEESCRLGLLCS